MNSAQASGRSRGCSVNSEEWRNIEPRLQMMDGNSAVFRRLQGLARSIAIRIESIDAVLEQLCKHTCRSCTDPCCLRASVWYDLGDILFYRLHTGSLPLQQIVRDAAGGCIHLFKDGCVLPRCERPFVCTWYICPAQKKILHKLPRHEFGVDLLSVINVIKKERRLLGECFLSAAQDG